MSDETKKPENVRFIFEKSKYFRVIHVDGAHGALTPSGRGITMSLFSERRTIPKEMTFGLSGEHQLSEEPVKIEDREGIFREVEVCAIMDMPTAAALHKWLTKQLENFHELRKVIENQRTKKEE